MVTFITGGANYDISGAVCNEIIKLLENGSGNIFYIIPDQFTFETEKEVCLELKKRNLLRFQNKIRFVTFASLSGEILDSFRMAKPVANSIVKNIVMHKAVKEQKNALSLLKGVTEKAGFCQKMVGTVSMLKTSGINANDLDENAIRKKMLSDSDGSDNKYGSVAKKLCDVIKIYRSYESYLSDYIDSLDFTAKAAELITNVNNHLFDGANIFVNYFNDFTSSQLNFLEKLMCRADNFTLGFVCTPEDTDTRDDVFYTARTQISKLRKEAADNNLEVKYITDGFSDRMENSPELSELSRKIFGYTKGTQSLNDCCQLIRAADVDEELDFVAAKIRQLCLEKGYLYRDIAVLCTDAQLYGKRIDAAFNKYDIPFFKDIPRTILFRPAVNLILSLLDVLRNFSLDTLLIYIKTGFICKSVSINGKETKIPLSDKEIDIFESYIFEWNLRTHHLKKNTPFNFCSKNGGKFPETEQTAEIVRVNAVVPVIELQKRLKKADGSEMTQLIFNFINESLDIRKGLYNRTLSPNGDNLDIVRSERQVWDALVEIFETLYKELRNINISLDDYYRLFYDICAETDPAMPPQYLDSVLVGSIDRTRTHRIRAAFIVGADYKRFPTPASAPGIFSQFETRIIIENIADISAVPSKEYCLRSGKEQYCLSLYRAYRAVSLPSDYLCLSYFDYENGGTQNQPSEVIGSILRLFPGSKIIKADSFGDDFYCSSLKAAKIRYAEKFYLDEKKRAVLREVLKKMECREYLDRLDEVSHFNSDDISRSDAHTVESKTAQIILPRICGATAIEALDDCKFRFFCRYVLGIEEPTRRVFNFANRGNIMHYVLQMVLKHFSGNINAFIKLGRAELVGYARHFLQEYIEKETNGDFSDDKRSGFLFYNIANTAADVLITMQAEFSVGKFRPKFFELKLSENRRLPIIDDCSVNAVPPAARLYIEGNTDCGTIPDYSAKDESGLFLNVNPLEISLSSGTNISISGIIDRVDMFSSDEGSRFLRVVDYKTKSKPFDKDLASNGINIQMLLYMMALCDANKDNAGINLKPGEISYIPSKNSGAADTELSPMSLLALNHCPTGFYIRENEILQEREEYRNYILNAIAKENNTSPDKLDSDLTSIFSRYFGTEDEKTAVNPEEFGQLCGDCLSVIKGNLEDAFGGNYSAIPLQIGNKAENCEYCRFQLICGNKGETHTVKKKDKAKEGE